MEEIIKDNAIEQKAPAADLEQVIIENRKKVQEDLARAAEEAKAARIAKFNLEDEELFRAFNAGVQRRMVEAMNSAAAEQMKQADEQIIELFKTKPNVKVPQHEQHTSQRRRRKHHTIYVDAYGSVGIWCIALILVMWLIARMFGVA